MDVKIALNKVNSQRRLIKSIEQQLKETEEDAMSIKAITMDERIVGGETTNKIETDVERIIKLEKELNSIRSKLIETKTETLMLINTIHNSNIKAVFIQRYINGVSRRDLPSVMSYSDRHINRLLKKGYKIIEKNTRN